VYKFIGLDGNPAHRKASIGGRVLMGVWESAEKKSKKNQIYFNIFNGRKSNTQLMAALETIQPLIDKYTFQ
jgi:hypothetical protein